MAARSPLVRRVGTAAGVILLAAGVTLAAAAPAAAAPPFCTTSWTGGTGSWSDATRWSTGAVPTADDYACVLRASGAATPTVTVGASAAVHGVTLIGATLRLPAAGTVLTAGEAVVTRSLVAGRGTVQGTEFSALRFLDARLGSGVTARAAGSVYVTGTLTFTGGSRLEHVFPAGLFVFDGDATLADGDGNPANHVTFGSFDMTVAAGRTVTVAVPSQLRYARVAVAGTLDLAAYAGLDAAGVLGNDDATYAGLITYDAGRILLPRSVTRIGPGTVLDGSATVLTPGGTDALADLASVAGTLSIGRPLTLPRVLDVVGGLDAQAGLKVDGLTVRAAGHVSVRTSSPAPATALVSPLVQVESTAAFGARSLTGRLESAGTNSLPGGRVGGLRLAPTAVTTLSLTYPATVDRTATVGGALKVLMPAERDLPADGAQIVLLTAARGVTGQFASVAAQPARRGTLTLAYTATQVVATFHTA